MSVRTLLAAVGSLIAVHGASAAPETAPGAFPFCSWWTETTATGVNVAFPDSSAAYWTTPFTASADLEAIILTGQYLDARYFSVTAYNNAGGTYSCPDSTQTLRQSELTDFAIASDPGSENPFVTATPPTGTFTIKLKHPLEAGASNTLPMADSTCAPAPSTTGVLPADLGFLVLRAYLPNGGFDSVKLPTLSLKFTNGAVMTLPQCGSQSLAARDFRISPSIIAAVKRLVEGRGERSGVLPQPCGRPSTQACPPELTFFRAEDSTANSFFPNNDNKYISALVRPKRHEVLVIRGKAPTFPPGTEAQPWDPSATELRYWSLCSNIYRRPYPVVAVDDPTSDDTIVGCAADLDPAIDGATGYYTYVVSHVEDRPAQAVLDANHATWLPFSSRQPHAPHLMILRNMLGDNFPNSVQHCAAGKDQQSIDACRESMGEYYPQAATCRAATFNAGGTQACFNDALAAAR
jgi:hypothetical protein